MKGYLLPLLFGLAASDPVLLSFNWRFSDPFPEGSPNITFRMGPWYTPYESRYAFTYHFRFTDSLSESGTIGIRPETDSLGKKMIHAVFSSHNTPGITTDDTNCQIGVNGGSDVRPDPNAVTCSHYVYLHEDWPNYLTTFELGVRKAGNAKWVGTILDTKTGLEHQIGSWTLPHDSGNVRLDGDGGRGHVQRVNIDLEHCDDFPSLILWLEKPFLGQDEHVKADLDHFQEGAYCLGEKRLKVRYLPKQNYFVTMGDIDKLPMDEIVPA